MRRLLIASLFLLSACGAAQHGATHDACTRDDDCVLTQGDCCFSAPPACGVARSRSGAAEFSEACARTQCEMGGMASCVDEDANVRAACVQGFCRTVR